jgi:hypothetical protein
MIAAMKACLPEARGAIPSERMRRHPRLAASTPRVQALLPAGILLISFLLLAALFLLGNRTAYHAILWQLGFNPFDFPFLDAHGVLATAECYRQGIDVIARNPCDALGRTLDYSPFWLITGKFGLRTSFTTQAGFALDALFLISVFFLPTVRGWASVAAMTAALLSSAVALGLERANLDLGVFVIGLAAANWSLRAPAWRAIGYGSILFAALIKYYPGAMLVLAARERLRVVLALAALALGIAAAFVAIEGTELARALKNIESGSRFSINFGAANLPIALGAIFSLREHAATLVLESCGLLLAVCGALLLRRHEDFDAALEALDPRRRALMLLGSALIAGCFFAAQNAPYRCIYFLFVLPGLCEMRRLPVSSAARRRAARITTAAIFLLWGQFFQRALAQTVLALDLPLGLANAMQLVFWLAREAMWWWVVTALLAFVLSLLERSPLGRHLCGLALRRRKTAPLATPGN